MATFTREAIGAYNDKLILTLEQKDYLPAFEKSLKSYGKTANMPGFRKGMVPAGLIKKMYGASLFTEEVLRSVDRELINYLDTEKLEILGQPLPLETDLSHIDMSKPADYTFNFEIGIKPEFTLPDLAATKTTKYKVTTTEEMIDEEVKRVQERLGSLEDEEAVSGEDTVLGLTFTEVTADGAVVEGGVTKENSVQVKSFSEEIRKDLLGKKVGDKLIIALKQAIDEKEYSTVAHDLGFHGNEADEKFFEITLNKVSLLQVKELNEEAFLQLYPNGEVKTIEELRAKIKESIDGYWESQAVNQLQDQAYHLLLDEVTIPVPEAFLAKWLKFNQTQDQNAPQKTDEEIEKEMPTFLNQLKWTLISDKIAIDNNVKIDQEEVREFAKQQLFQYLGGSIPTDGESMPWVDDYIEKMMKDRKYVEDTYTRLRMEKVFDWITDQVKPTEEAIEADAFTKMVQEHQHSHH